MVGGNSLTIAGTLREAIASTSSWGSDSISCNADADPDTAPIATRPGESIVNNFGGSLMQSRKGDRCCRKSFSQRCR